MRAYLIKDEGTFERLAKEKFQEDGGVIPQVAKKDSSGCKADSKQSSLASIETPESFRSMQQQKQYLNSYLNSSDESVHGGSNNSGTRERIKRRAKKKKSATRNNSSENLLVNVPKKCLSTKSESDEFNGQIKKVQSLQHILPQVLIPKPPKTE